MDTKRRGRSVLAIAAVLLLPACGSKTAAPAFPATGTATVQVGGRDVTVHVPPAYDPNRPAPLVIALHGYTSDGKQLENYLQLTPQADQHRFVYAYPDGTTDSQGNRFWNATDACCAFDSQPPDDSRYLSDLITRIEGSYKIDRARVYLVGHSNGAFMAFRMACEHADQVTAIVAVNGATWNDPARCRPSEPVSVLAVHSADDETILFGGGAINGNGYPSAATTVTRWLGYDHCAATGRATPALDLAPALPGAETSARTYDQGCAGGSVVQSWTIAGGIHVPPIGPAFAQAATDFLLSRAKPAR